MEREERDERERERERESESERQKQKRRQTQRAIFKSNLNVKRSESDSFIFQVRFEKGGVRCKRT